MAAKSPEETLAWQKKLNQGSYTDYENKPLAEDSIWGPRTQTAFDKYQTSTQKPALQDAVTPAATVAPAPVVSQPSLATQNEQDIMGQLRSKMNQTVDPLQTPYGQAAMGAATQSAADASRSAMEDLNARGILNSTVTADRVSRISQQMKAQVLPDILAKVYGMQQNDVSNLMGLLDYYSKQRASEDATKKNRQEYLFSKWKANGAADNEVALGLGVHVGTTYYEYAQEQKKLDAQQKQYDAQNMLEQQRINASKTSAPKTQTAMQQFEDGIIEKLKYTLPLSTQEQEYAVNKGWVAGKTSAAQTTRDERASAYEAIDGALNNGTSIADIKAEVAKQRAELIRKGVNPDELLKYLDELQFSQAAK